MNRKGLFVLVIMLSTFLTVSLSSSVFAAEWLFYDDGDCNGGCSIDAGDYFAVRFTPTCSNAKILTVQFYVRGRITADVILHILADDWSTELLTPNPTITLTSGDDYWVEYDVSVADVYVSDDFYVALELIVDKDPYIGYDVGNIDERSYHFFSTGGRVQYTDRDLMIRAEIVCPSSEVGGDVFSIDKFSILTPYLIIAIIIITATSFLVKKRKQ